MDSYSRLGAVWTEMGNFLEGRPGVFAKSDDDGKLLILGQAIPPEQLSLLREIPLENPSLLDRVNCCQQLLRLRPMRNFEEAVGLLILEKEIEDCIDHAKIECGRLTWHTECFRSIDAALLPDYDVLVAAQYLKQGFKVQEVPGSHFVITGPTGLQHVTKPFSCSCSNYNELKDCGHLRLVKTILANRRTFQTYKIIELA
jgi:hypothetical protein